jgi:MerR family transcriptional regulator, heat shock protein HspR
MARRDSTDQAIYIISVAAELAGVHPQTLRVYERKGLVTPQRTEGNTRRYSERDVERLRKIQELTTDGINLAGVTRIIELERDIERLQARYARAVRDLETLEQQLEEAMDARNRMAMVPLRDVRRIRRAMKSDELSQPAARRVFPAPPVS